MARPKLKTAAATVKLTPQVRAAWEAAAARERRSLSNFLEIVILDWCERHGVPVPDPAGAPAREPPDR